MSHEAVGTRRVQTMQDIAGHVKSSLSRKSNRTSWKIFKQVVGGGGGADIIRFAL